MTTRGSASRYARALLDVAIKESIADRAEQDLAAFAALLAQYADVQSALTHPAVPAKKKRVVVAELASRLGLSAPVIKLLSLLADRDRLALVPELLDVYRERLLDHQQVIRAEVTTAEPLPRERESQLQDRLSVVTTPHRRRDTGTTNGHQSRRNLQDHPRPDWQLCRAGRRRRSGHRHLHR
jgi:F-type H+-transporting ATPase subunit delta